MAGGIASQEILRLDQALEIRGTCTSRLGIARSVADFKSFFKGLTVEMEEVISFLVSNGERLKDKRLCDESILEGTFLSERTYTETGNKQGPHG